MKSRQLKSCIALFIVFSTPLSLQASEKAVVWIGTDTKSESKGIYRAELDLASGKLTQPELATELIAPGFIALAEKSNKSLLYTIHHVADSRAGHIAAYEILDQGKTLKLINSIPIGDGRGVHLTLDQTAKYLFTAQYGASSVAVFPLAKDGSIQPRSDLKKHSGSGPNKARQKRAHPHSVYVSPDNQYLMVPDLGIDKVMIYKINHSEGTLMENGFAACPPGSGPRHMKFHPNGIFAYVLNELLMTISVFRYDSNQGVMNELQVIPTLPQDLWEVPNKASEIRMDSKGKFLYAANRGHDTIAAFSVDSNTGKLTFIEREPVRGAYPRNFHLDPTDTWLLAAARDSNTLSVFKIDQENGNLIYHNQIVNCPAPICIEFQKLQ
ncbi:MAG: lactonase family protein [Verrucomicrobiota bacterium]